MRVLCFNCTNVQFKLFWSLAVPSKHLHNCHLHIYRSFTKCAAIEKPKMYVASFKTAEFLFWLSNGPNWSRTLSFPLLMFVFVLDYRFRPSTKSFIVNQMKIAELLFLFSSLTSDTHTAHPHSRASHEKSSVLNRFYCELTSRVFQRHKTFFAGDSI